MEFPSESALRSGPALARCARALDIALLENLVEAAEGESVQGREEMAGKAAAFFRMLRPARLPQMTTSSHSRVNGRRTLRDVVRHGGQLARVHYHERARQRRLVVLIDGSESGLRRGLATLGCALRRVNPRIVVLGFDTEVYELRGANVEANLRQMEERCSAAQAEGKTFLSLRDLDLVLRQARRFAPLTPQSYLLIVSDLIVPDDTRVDPATVSRLRGTLRRYQRCWLVDARPTVEPFVEDEEGLLACSAEGLLKLMTAARGGAPARLGWRRSETQNLISISFAQLRLWDQQNMTVALEARRFTPSVRAIGFSMDDASAGNPLIFIPQNRPADFAEIFRELPLY